MNPEIYDKTKKLIRELNLFIVHIFVYFLSNVTLALYVFRDVSSRWIWLFIIVCWALLVIYHGLRVYGIDPVKSKKEPKLLSVMTKLIGI